MFAIQQIYDAAFEERKFPELLESIVGYLGAQAGFIAWSNDDSLARFEAQYGNEPIWLQRYVETWAAHDNLRPHLFGAPEGEPITAYPLFQQPEIRESPFYRGFVAPQGIVDNLAVNLIKRDNMMGVVAVLRMGDVPPFDSGDIARMRALVPHLRRATVLASYRIRQDNLIQAYRQTAHGARDGLVLLDDAGRVIDLGPEVERMTGLSADAASRSAFGKAMAAVIGTDEPSIYELEGTNGTPVRLLLRSQALERNPFGDLSEGPGAAHAVSVTALDRRWGLAYASIAAAHKLTPGEARVLEDVLTHGEMTASSDRLGMARATARSHLHRIYAKTGTRGFADLCLFAHRFIVPRI